MKSKRFKFCLLFLTLPPFLFLSYNLVQLKMQSKLYPLQENYEADYELVERNQLTTDSISVNSPTKIDLSAPALSRPADRPLNGIGERGDPVVLGNLTEDEKIRKQELWDIYGINHFLSDKISLHRALREFRHPLCVDRSPFNYKKLPNTSVIIVFYNEGWSTLLRTIYSVLHNTPDILLEEIILIDDGSTIDNLGKELYDYIANLPKIKLIRTGRREGLMRARLLGLAQAVGEVVAFVDCHCECTHGWLEPLLEGIAEDRTLIAIPVTDDIDSKTFQYYFGAYTPSIGGFTWQLYFQWRWMSKAQENARKNLAEPIRTPTISGGLLAVDRKFFIHLGSYDEGMEVWGGENLELSFRTWMCGGSMKVFPCSHIGHVSRDHNTYSRATFWKNVMRLAEVWLDDYKRHFDIRVPPSEQNQNFGDVTARKKLRENLKCHDFKWYLKNVFPEQHVPEDRPGYYGAIENIKLKGNCLDVGTDNTGEPTVLLYGCHSMSSQFFEYTSKGELRHNKVNEQCLEVNGNDVTSSACTTHENVPKNGQTWMFVLGGVIASKLNGECLEAVQQADGVYKAVLLRCDPQSNFQKWNFLK